MRGDICEDYSPNSAQYGRTIAKATTGLRTHLRRIFLRKLEAQGRWMESSPDRIYLLLAKTRSLAAASKKHGEKTED
jgi:hypothetical protein